jgi:hypothetical protein
MKHQLVDILFCATAIVLALWVFAQLAQAAAGGLLRLLGV